jgi:hypothetical protein
VELVGHYSNLDDWDLLVETTQALAHPQPDSLPSETVSVPVRGRRPWPVTKRLGEQAIQALLHDRHSGVILHELSERYGISVSSVKRILRNHRCYRSLQVLLHDSSSVLTLELLYLTILSSRFQY